MFAFHNLLDRVRRGIIAVAETVEVHYQLTASMAEQLDRIETKVDSIVAREQVSWDLYQNNVAALVDGYKSVTAENKALRDQVDSLGKSTQDRINKAVNEALAADDEHDAQRIDAANNALPIIEHGAPVPPKPVDATPQTTEDGSHDVMGPDGTPVTVGPDSDADGDSVADPDDASNETNDEDSETTSDPAVNSGDDSGQTATTGDHSSENANQGSAEESNGGDISGQNRN